MVIIFSMAWVNGRSISSQNRIALGSGAFIVIIAMAAQKTAATITRCINCSMFLQSCLFEEQEVALDGFTAGVTS